MKFTAISIMLIGSAAAFTAPKPSSTTSSSLNVANTPIFSPPAVLDGELAGDYKFDPFNFSKNKQDLKLYREAEIKHARLAMLAAVGWPLSELFNPKLAAELDLPAMTTPSDLAPGVLNGNISDVNPLFFIAALTLGAMIEVGAQLRTEEPRFIGDIGFDPLNAYPKDPELQMKIQEAEINNGRLAMLAITGFALSEAANHVGIIDLTPQFF